MTYEIKNNLQFNSLEVYFNEKPGAEICAALKALKFRFNPRKFCWYGFADPEKLAAACEGQAAEPTPAADQDEQTRARALYLAEVRNYWGEKSDMVKHCDKTTAYIVELKNGDIIAIDKPRIETRFCFGHGMYGVTTDEDERRAYDMAEHAATNEQYFINENLEGINETIQDLKDAYKVYTFLNYCHQDENSKLKAFRTARSVCYGPEYEPGLWGNLQQLQELDADDIARIIKGYEIVKQQFIKRLNTYLKRYGLTKVKTWTYLVD